MVVGRQMYFAQGKRAMKSVKTVFLARKNFYFHILKPFVGHFLRRAGFRVSGDAFFSRLFHHQQCMAHKPEVSICNEMQPFSLRYHLFLELKLLVLNKNNCNPTCSLLGTEPIRSVLVTRPNLIGHYLARILF